MSVDANSCPVVGEDDAHVKQEDMVPKLVDTSPKLNESLEGGESSLLLDNPGLDSGSHESAHNVIVPQEIGATPPSTEIASSSLKPSAMSSGVGNSRTGFVHDGVDNLHGLSIARNSAAECTAECSENHLGDVADGKIERMNPFNSNVKQEYPKSSHYPEPMPKFLSLDSFGNEDVPTNALEEDLSKLQLGGSPEDLAGTLTRGSPKFNGGGILGLHTFSPSHSGFDRDVFPPTVPPPPADPWVRISPEPPARVEAPLPLHSPKTEREVNHEEEANLTEIPQQGLCLDGELKKAPAIDQSTTLGPMVLDIPGPCEPEDLIEGIIFSANYLGTTQLVSNRNAAKNARMFQAQEAVNRIKAPDGESQPTVEVDLFISTTKIKILNANTQETMMSHTLRSISYIADIGDLLVIMAKRHPSPEEQSPEDDGVIRKEQPKKHRIICHVLSSSDSHLIAESIGQCFNVAYQQFLQSNCIEPQNLTQADFNQLLDTQEMYHDDLVHYSKQENVKEIWVEKKNGETMGIAIVESGWGSIIPTVILANLQHGSPIERNGRFSIGDQIMAINGTSLVGLPLQACHSIIKGLRNQTLVKINIVSCPPVVSVLIKRPNLKHQLGFSVQTGIICSLMRGGIAERGGVRVGHRIIEINNQSVVATPHDKIVQMLVTSVGEIQMKTMPAAMYRLLTGQEQPIYL